jgi:hypothetical protein
MLRRYSVVIRFILRQFHNLIIVSPTWEITCAMIVRKLPEPKRDIFRLIIDVSLRLGLLADAVTPKETFPCIKREHLPLQVRLPESQAPLLKQPIYGTTSVIRPDARRKQSQPYHQSCV